MSTVGELIEPASAGLRKPGPSWLFHPWERFPSGESEGLDRPDQATCPWLATFLLEE